MTHKSVLLVLACAIGMLPGICSAQTQQASFDSVVEVARADMRAERVKIITAAMNFSDKDAAAFWPVYRKYEAERSAMDDQRVAVIKEYAQKFSTLQDADAKAMAERMFDCDAGLAAMKKKYYEEFNAVLPALTVTKFFQLDHRIDLLMDMKVESSLPPLFGVSEPALQGSPQADSQVN